MQILWHLMLQIREDGPEELAQAVCPPRAAPEAPAGRVITPQGQVRGTGERSHEEKWPDYRRKTLFALQMIKSGRCFKKYGHNNL